MRALAADGRLLASAGADNTVKLWDVLTGRKLRTLAGHTDLVTSLAFSADSQVVASASYDRSVKLWDAQSGQEIHTLRGHVGHVMSVALPTTVRH